MIVETCACALIPHCDFRLGDDVNLIVCRYREERVIHRWYIERTFKQSYMYEIYSRRAWSRKLQYQINLVVIKRFSSV